MPRFDGTESLLLATGILGATVMPHVIYLHSALTKPRILPRTVEDRRFLLRRQQIDVVLGMGLAGFVNPSMLIIAATLFFGSDVPDTDTLEGVYAGLAAVVDRAAFAFALGAAGVRVRVLGRGHLRGPGRDAGLHPAQHPAVPAPALTLAPALVVLGLGVDPTQALVLSQVVLSFGIPFALVPLVLLTRRSDLMAELVNRRTTTAVAAVIAALIITLNGFLIWQTIAGS